MAGRVRRAALRAVAVVVLAAVVDPIGAVQAHNVPTDQDVERARAAQERTDRAVADAQERLDALAAQLDEARVRAESAVEAYNGARVGLARARRAEESAVAGAEQVRDKQTTADIELGRLAAATYRSGGGFSELGIVVNIVTDSSIIDVSDALAAVTRSQSAVHARWSAALKAAETTVREAEEQVAERTAAERSAERALERAKNAVAEHEHALERAEEKRDALLLELAAARGTTAELERERQSLAEQREQVERRRAEEARSRTGQDAGVPAEQNARDSGDSATAAGDEPDPDRGDEAAPDGRPSTSAPAGNAEPAGSSFATAAAADRAIAYARAQLGKPYVWAGTGPAGFDCSGLTMRAWEHGGAQLTHWSVAQARQTMPVSFADLRRGDLIFWSSDDSPSGTYHVALYIGGGEMIHAPSPGGHVEIQDVFYWRAPSFYARVVI